MGGLDFPDSTAMSMGIDTVTPGTSHSKYTVDNSKKKIVRQPSHSVVGKEGLGVKGYNSMLMTMGTQIQTSIPTENEADPL